MHVCAGLDDAQSGPRPGQVTSDSLLIELQPAARNVPSVRGHLLARPPLAAPLALGGFAASLGSGPRHTRSPRAGYWAASSRAAAVRAAEDCSDRAASSQTGPPSSAAAARYAGRNPGQ